MLILAYMALRDEAQMFVDGLAAMEFPPFETMDVEMQRSILDPVVDSDVEPPRIHSSVDQVVAGSGGDIPIRIFRPNGDSDLPVVLYFHGGGWVIGTLDSHDALCRAIANAATAVVVSVDYRLAPEHRYPAAFDDCAAVMAWVHANAVELDVDGSKMAVAGDSAGGNLAAAVALLARDQDDPKLAAQLLIYPACNLVDIETDSYSANGEGYLLTSGWMGWFIDQYVPEAADRAEGHASPALSESHCEVAPALVLTAEYDLLLDDGKAYADTLRDAGVDVDYFCFDGHVHGFASQIGVMDAADEAVAKMAGFLAKRW
jgi:acetyl esterase